MTREERNIKLKHLITCMRCEVSGKVCDENCSTQYECGNMGEIIENLEAISKIMEQEPCDDAISRSAVLAYIYNNLGLGDEENGNDVERQMELESSYRYVKSLPPVTLKEKTGLCKDCKFFEYDSVAKVNGIPLIVAHEICKRWGDGCKAREDGYCFLFEPQESVE